MKKLIIFSTVIFIVIVNLKLFAQSNVLGDLNITYPEASTKIKFDETLTVLWKYTGAADVKANIYLSTDDGESWRLLESSVSLLAHNFKKDLKDLKLGGSKDCKIKIEGSLTEKLESNKFEIERNSDLEAPYFVSTGVNLNYASDPKVNGLYFSVTSSIKSVILDSSNLDVMLAQGRTQSQSLSQNKVSGTITKTTITSNYQNIYAIASFKHKFFNWNQFKFIFPQIELRAVQKKVNLLETVKPDNGIETTTKDNNNDTVVFQHLAGIGAGYTFKNSIMKLDLDIIFGYPFKHEKDEWMNIIRFNLKTLLGFNIGGEIRNPIKGNNNDANSNSEVLIYMSKDIDIDGLAKILKL